MMNFFTRLVSLGLAGLLSLGIAFAANVEARFGNTVLVAYPDGTAVKFFYNAVKTFSAKIEKDGNVLAETKGTWRVDAANICLTSEAPFGPFEPGKERCVPLQGDKVGDTWTVPGKDAKGNDIVATGKIVAGR
jgi:hypothetical protein